MTPVPCGTWFGNPPRVVRRVRVEALTQEEPDAHGVVYWRADCRVETGDLFIMRQVEPFDIRVGEAFDVAFGRDRQRNEIVLGVL